MSLCYVQSANALTYDELQGLSYKEIKGTGLANTCPTINGGSTNPKDIKPGEYSLDKFCLEPTSITVKEDSQASFVPVGFEFNKVCCWYFYNCMLFI